MDSTTATPAQDRGYDQVRVPGPGGSTRVLSEREFEQLPLRERVSFLIDGAAQFFRGGVPISAADAMRK